MKMFSNFLMFIMTISIIGIVVTTVMEIFCFPNFSLLIFKFLCTSIFLLWVSGTLKLFIYATIEETEKDKKKYADRIIHRRYFK